MSTYILLKDLPDAKVGTEFVLDYVTLNGTPFLMYVYGKYGNHPKSLDRDTVEGNPDWFKLKEEKVWTDSDMIEFACEISGIMRGHVKTGLDEFKLMKHQNAKQ